jgi:hypothetical protein
VQITDDGFILYSTKCKTQIKEQKGKDCTADNKRNQTATRPSTIQLRIRYEYTN